jgi:Flp pilus assembly pilin Flp
MTGGSTKHNNCKLHGALSRKSTAMPPSRRRPLRAFARTETGGAAVESALILSLTAVMIFTLKTTSGVTALVKPFQQSFATLLKALGG